MISNSRTPRKSPVSPTFINSMMPGSGAQWEKMTKANVIKLEADLEARKKSTRMEKAKPRAKHSDAGKKHS